MKKVKAFLFSWHRVLGTIISLFFLMWFVSGLVLIYHDFPNVTPADKYERQEALPDSLPEIRNLLSRLPESDRQIRSVKVRRFQEQTLFFIQTKDSLYSLCADSTEQVKPITVQTLSEIAKKWSSAPPIRVDTLFERDQWIMYSRYLNEMPIYKLYFDDDEKHQLYVSSQSGEVQQFTNREQRFWAWVGAIPHKLYFPVIRKNTDVWTTVLTIGGVLAMLAALTGLCIGVYATYKKYRATRKLGTPYKKHWYKWHHVLGLVFGITLVTFAFSGAMSLQRIPQWIIKTHEAYRVSSTQLRGKPLSLDRYLLDYRALVREYPEVKTIEWTHFRDVPIYVLVTENRKVCIDASLPEAKELYLSQSEIEKAVLTVHKGSSLTSLTTIIAYEDYYMSRKKELPLPVYKVEVDNADHSLYYIDPKTGDFKYLNQSRKVRKWIFSGLHYLNINWLVERPILWTIAMWTLCLGGAYVSLSGCWLGVLFIRKKIRSKQNKHRIKKS